MIRKVTRLSNIYKTSFTLEERDIIEEYIIQVLNIYYKYAFYIIDYSIYKKNLIEISNPRGELITSFYLAEI